MELWNQKAVKKSEKVLRELRKHAEFVLIGGWATFLWTKTIKSIDVDIYVNFEDFYKLQSILSSKGIFVNLNRKLKKYNTKVDEIDIDIYTPDQCKLIVPCEDVFKNKWYETIERFKVVKAEVLLLLKLDVEQKRKQTIKGFKDRCDVLSILANLELDFDFLGKLFKKYKCQELVDEAIRVVRDSKKEYEYALQKEIIPSELKRLKSKLIKKLRFL